MLIGNIGRSFRNAFNDTGVVLHQSFSIIKQNPQITTYPYLAGLFNLVTVPLVSGLAYEIWHKVHHPAVLAQVSSSVPQPLRVRLGLVTFTLFYTTLVTAYFTCAVSAETLAKLDSQSTPPAYGIWQVLKHFLRVSRFALVSLLFFPIGTLAQWRKLPRGIIWVVGGSLTLNMSNLSPAILSQKNGVFSTIRHVGEVMGPVWPVGVILKIGSYLFLAAIVALGFLPKLIQHYRYGGETARAVGWLLSILLGASLFVTARVMSAVFTSVLYHQASKK
jgi:hypothetical protein